MRFVVFTAHWVLSGLSAQVLLTAKSCSRLSVINFLSSIFMANLHLAGRPIHDLILSVSHKEYLYLQSVSIFATIYCNRVWNQRNFMQLCRVCNIELNLLCKLFSEFNTYDKRSQWLSLNTLALPLQISSPDVINCEHQFSRIVWLSGWAQQKAETHLQKEHRSDGQREEGRQQCHQWVWAPVPGEEMELHFYSQEENLRQIVERRFA